jgi:hydroxymethylpyrimidine pyrophosphatase-like HAD family hydrolase
MRYLALATDYDGTLAKDGVVSGSTLRALQLLLDTGRKLILVTGRQLDDLRTVFPQLKMFHRVVAENGALLYDPASNEERVLCEKPPQALLDELKRRRVPFSVGHAIVATHVPHDVATLRAIKALGLELQVIFNKGAVMVLPSGVNKSTGLDVALARLGLSRHNTVGVGDAENDHAFLACCECAVAVENALPALKQRADLVTKADRGNGVREVIDQMIADDLTSLEPRLARHNILLGSRVVEGDGKGAETWLKPYGGSVLVAGPSGSGKSTTTTGILERLIDCGYQFCLVDPEGDYENLPDALILGDQKRAPSSDEVANALKDPKQSVVANLLGVPLADRPLFLAALLPRLQELRARTARPHWIVVDEAHHLLPSQWVPAPGAVPQELAGMLLITMRPDHVAAAALKAVNVVLAAGKQVDQTLHSFCSALKVECPPLSSSDAPAGAVLAWFRYSSEPPALVKPVPGDLDRKRHRRKYATGELKEDESFYFRGPENKLNLRAQNLSLFIQLADGVDDETWMHHLRRGDYSNWFRKYIKDPELAEEAAAVEQRPGISAEESRHAIKAVIEQRYTAAA